MVAPVSPISLFHLPPVTPIRATAKVQRDENAGNGSGDANSQGLETPQDVVSISGGAVGGTGDTTGSSAGKRLRPFAAFQAASAIGAATGQIIDVQA